MSVETGVSGSPLRRFTCFGNSTSIRVANIFFSHELEITKKETQEKKKFGAPIIEN